ncbi:MAG TPA: DUF4230 domain-containing protein [Patescibacteria group bacterium]|nr:DUF4230 domain-containing protein [Patescibacteria group bacterium]HLP49168.1 DUF4230 domain-containing protein [Candidatus Kapabacteria bacterium]
MRIIRRDETTQTGDNLKPILKTRRHPWKKKWLLILIFMLFISTACQDNSQNKKYLIGQIKKMSDITLVEVKLKKFLIFKKKKKILFFKFKDATQAICIKPRIELGFNLDQITEKDIKIDEDSKCIRLEVPPLSVKIFEYDAENNYGDVVPFLTENKEGNKIGIDDIEKMHRYAENEVRKSVNLTELRSACEEKARNSLQAFFANLDYNLDVVFKSSESPYLMSFESDLTLDKLMAEDKKQ